MEDLIRLSDIIRSQGKEATQPRRRLLLKYLKARGREQGVEILFRSGQGCGFPWMTTRRLLRSYAPELLSPEIEIEKLVNGRLFEFERDLKKCIGVVNTLIDRIEKLEKRM